MTEALLSWLKTHELETLTLTLYGEARGEPIEGRIAVGSVVLNRAKREYRGRSVADVCLYPLQFSCWQPTGGVSNFVHVIRVAEAVRAGGVPSFDVPKLRDIYAETGWVADGLLKGLIRDRVAGARHYATRTLYNSPKAPEWLREAPIVCEIGSHVFVRAN